MNEGKDQDQNPRGVFDSDYYYVAISREHEDGTRVSVSYAGRGPRGYRRSDESLYEEVCETLTKDRSVDASEIEVQVKDGIVTLSGNVGNRNMKRRAEDCIDRVSGVVDIQNRLRIEDLGSGFADLAARAEEISQKGKHLQ